MKILEKNKGFTLVEMLVTALIFSIVIGSAMGVFVSAIKLQRYNLAHQQLLNQTSYAVEYMDRAIRMAVKNDGTCGAWNKNYNFTESSISFRSYYGDCLTFFWVPGDPLKVNINGDEYNLTSDDFEIIDFSIDVTGDSLGDNLQPKVEIFIEIERKGVDRQPRIKVQTTISQRNLDI